MSTSVRNVLDALLLGFAAFMYFLAVSNGNIADQALKRELTKPVCVPPSEARAVGAMCVVLARSGGKT